MNINFSERNNNKKNWKFLINKIENFQVSKRFFSLKKSKPFKQTKNYQMFQNQ